MPDLQDQIRQLHTHIDELEVSLGRVCGQYVEITAMLAPFLARYRDEVLRYHKALVMAQREVADVRAYLGDSKALAEGESSTPLDEFLKREDIVSVQEQYERVWGGKNDTPAAETGDESLPPASDELRKLYGRAVAHLHPELALSSAERRSRISLFNQVNIAYLRRDINTVRMAADASTPRSNLPALIDDKALKTLRERVYVLEELISRTEAQYYDFRYGDVAKVRAYAKRAEAQGKDFLANLSDDIQSALRNTAEELVRLKSNLPQT